MGTYSCEAHVLDVVKVVDYTPPRSSAIVPIQRITSRRHRAISSRKPIGQDLIHRLRFPLRRCKRSHRVGECESREDGSELHCVCLC